MDGGASATKATRAGLRPPVCRSSKASEMTIIYIHVPIAAGREADLTALKGGDLQKEQERAESQKTQTGTTEKPPPPRPKNDDRFMIQSKCAFSGSHKRPATTNAPWRGKKTARASLWRHPLWLTQWRSEPV